MQTRLWPNMCDTAITTSNILTFLEEEALNWNKLSNCFCASELHSSLSCEHSKTMAELRRISYRNGNGAATEGSEAHHPPYTNGSGSQRHKGYKTSSYELESVHTDRNGGGGKNVQSEVPAVVVRNASKHYTKGVPVLQNLNMTVQRGAM